MDSNADSNVRSNVGSNPGSTVRSNAGSNPGSNVRSNVFGLSPKTSHHQRCPLQLFGKSPTDKCCI